MGILKDAILAAIQQEHPDAHWVGNEKPHVIESVAQAKYNDVRKVEHNYVGGVHNAKSAQCNTYYITDNMGRDTGIRYYASNKKEAMAQFKADTDNYKKYGYFGGLHRWYNGGVYGSSGKTY